MKLLSAAGAALSGVLLAIKIAFDLGFDNMAPLIQAMDLNREDAQGTLSLIFVVCIVCFFFALLFESVLSPTNRG